MSWKAALPMYNLSARLARDYEAFLIVLAEEAGQAVVAESPADLPAFWRREDLLISQTCGYPYVTQLRGQVTLLATPCYDFGGCTGSDYSSVLVVRDGAGIDAVADAAGRTAAINDPHSNSGMNVLRHAVAPLARGGRFFGSVVCSGSHAAGRTAAINDPHSNSGMNVLRHAVAPLARGGRFFGSVVCSGSHAVSVRMVRDGDADIAAIDCVTYGYLAQENPAAVAGLKVLGYSAPSPGLPLIAGGGVSEDVARRLRDALLRPSARLFERMRALRIVGFEYRGDADYERILELEADARAAGYPELL